MMDGIRGQDCSDEHSVKRLRDGTPLRRSSLAVGMALTLALAGIGQAQQSGKRVGMPLPDKRISAILFASRDVSNLEASTRFYSEVLGLKRVGGFDYDDGSAREVFLAFDDKPESVKIALQWKKASASEPLPETDGINRVVIQVMDIKKTRERAVAFGGKTVGELHRVDDVWMGGIVDPDGHRISLIQPD